MPIHIIYHDKHTAVFVICLYSSQLSLELIIRLLRASFMCHFTFFERARVEYEITPVLIIFTAHYQPIAYLGLYDPRMWVFMRHFRIHTDDFRINTETETKHSSVVSQYASARVSSLQCHIRIHIYWVYVCVVSENVVTSVTIHLGVEAESLVRWKSIYLQTAISPHFYAMLPSFLTIMLCSIHDFI